MYAELAPSEGEVLFLTGYNAERQELAFEIIDQAGAVLQGLPSVGVIDASPTLTDDGPAPSDASDA